MINAPVAAAKNLSSATVVRSRHGMSIVEISGLTLYMMEILPQ